VTMEFCKSRRKCKEVVDRSCDMRDCVLDVFSIDNETILSGGFCPKGNSENREKPRTNYVDVFHSIFDTHFRRYGLLLADLDGKSAPDKTVGIRRATSTIAEKGIWSAALLARLGFVPVASPVSNPAIARQGVDHSKTDFCIARKLVTGHAMLLMNHPGIRYQFNPTFVEHFQKDSISLKYCIYTESEAFILNDDLSIDPQKQFSPVLQFNSGPILVENIDKDLRSKGYRFSRRQIRDAIEAADAAEKAFLEDLYARGDSFLEKTKDRIAYLGIGRDYVVLDPEASSYAGAMFSQTRGLDFIPQIFLRHRFAALSQDLKQTEYWCESIDILRAHRYVASRSGLYPIRLMNFGCGPDSMKIYQEERIHLADGKPMLTLLTDAQTNNAPFLTRTEAFERVVHCHYLKEHGHDRNNDLQLHRRTDMVDPLHGNRQPRRGSVPASF